MKIACRFLLLVAAILNPVLADATSSPATSNADVSSLSLVGKVAPDFQLNDLSGKPVWLSDLRGKIVVLDFWRTECPPCIAGLPGIIKVATARKAQGVVFYAINLNEQADAVRAFQKERQLRFPVLLDSDRKIADLYLVDGPPVSVLINRAGKIVAVTVGYKPEHDAKLSEEIDALLSGKSLLTDGVSAESAKSP